MADLKVNIAGVEFNNPIIAASGTFGFGREYSEFYPLSVMGGISCKGITLKERLGNPARFGFPVFVVLDENGKVIHTQDSSFLEEGKSYNKEKVIRFFECWTPKAVKS